MRLIVLCPHFDPDTAPTGRVMTRIVAELAGRGHASTSSPPFRGIARHARRARVGRPPRPYRARRRGARSRGSTRSPAGTSATSSAGLLGFVGFSALAGWSGLAAGGWFRRADAVIAMSPPLTMGLTGRLVAWSHRAPLVFNIQDVFPDAAVETGAITNRPLIAAARGSSGSATGSSDAVTVLSDDLRGNVVAKVPAGRAATVRTIPNFVDTDRIRPADRMTAYRAELGIGDEPVVLYAGNVGFSQSLELLVETARRLPRRHVADQRRRRGARRRCASAPTA